MAKEFVAEAPCAPPGMTPEQIFAELDEFYESAASGAFRQFKPDFFRAAEETLSSMGKQLP
jgi:hypothetical protein